MVMHLHSAFSMLLSVCPRTLLFAAQYLGKHVPAEYRQRGRNFSEASSHGLSQEPLQLPKETSY